MYLNSENSLPLRATTNVRIEAIGREVRIILNGTIDSRIALSSDRFTITKPKPMLYVSSYTRVHKPAVANIGSIEMNQISTFSVDAPTNLIQGFVSKTIDVPQNYSLSFDIRPSHMLNGWSNILHYYENNARDRQGAKMPGTFLCSCSDSSF